MFKESSSLKASDFNSIESLDIRAVLLWKKGQFLQDRVVNNRQQVKIYSLFNFFVEVWVNLKNVQELEKIIALETEMDWNGYLGSICLSECLPEVTKKKSFLPGGKK